MQDEEQFGFIPGPVESKDSFLKRVAISKAVFNNPEQFGIKIEDKVKKPRLSWVKSQLLHLFNFSPDNFLAFFKNKRLSFFQGAATWIVEKEGQKIALIQLRKGLKKGRFLFYELEEILAHEFVHAARIAFDEPIFEEMLAYLTSSSPFRKLFGPIIRHSWEAFTFLILLILSLIWTPFWILSLLWISLGLFRLFFVRKIFVKTYKKLESFSKPLPIMIRLTDKEIISFSKMSIDEIKDYIRNSDSLRFIPNGIQKSVLD